MITPPRIAVIGGGFAGLAFTKSLKQAAVSITLIDKHNHHLFQPLLYQVASATLNPSDIAAPIRRILRKQKNVTVVLGEVSGVDVDAKKVTLRDGVVPYDYLVVATGVSHSYFGREEWERFAPGLKSMNDALLIRHRVLKAFEAAERETDQEMVKEWMTFVVVGAGPTGVELSGALAEMARRSFESDYRTIDPKKSRVVLVEAGDRVLPFMPASLSTKAARQLAHIGVEVVTGHPVTGIDAHGVSLGEERIPARTVLWAAGVTGSPLAPRLGAPLMPNGRVRVGADLSIPDHPDVFVIGDLAYVEHGKSEVPAVAPAALQQGRHAARQVMADIAGRPRKPFKYLDKGSLATIGRSAAVADIRGLRISGFVAWLIYLTVHLWFLVGFRSRVGVMIEWIRIFLTSDKKARLITHEVPSLFEHETADPQDPKAR